MPSIQGVRGFLFQNWSEKAQCRPKLYFEPENTDHLHQILLKAKELNQHVRLVGSGHSINDQVCTTDYLVSMKKINRIIKIDKDAKTVKAEAGAEVGDILSALAKHGLGLSIFGSALTATIGGSISTGTHKSGLKYKCLSAYVTEIELMTADGTIIKISREIDENFYRAAALSAGTLGIIVAVTLQCEPAFNLELRQVQVELDNVLGDFMNIARSSDHTMITWTPYAGTVIKHINRTTKKPTTAEKSFLWHVIFAGFFLEFFFWLSTFFTGLVPWINRKVFRNILSTPEYYVGSSAQIFGAPIPKHSRFVEWSVPIGHGAAAIRELKDWIYKTDYPANMVVNISFVGKDDLYMSQANGGDICTILLFMMTPYRKDVDYKPYWNALQQICEKRDGRFHLSEQPDMTAEEIVHIYPDAQKFHEVRHKLDPEGRFLTPQVARLTAAWVT